MSFKRQARQHCRACPAGPSQITLCSWNIDPTIIFPWKGMQDRPKSYKINTKSSCICLWIQCGGLVYNPGELHKKSVHFLPSSLRFPTSPPSSVEGWFDEAAALRPWSSGAVSLKAWSLEAVPFQLKRPWLLAVHLICLLSSLVYRSQEPFSHRH